MAQLDGVNFLAWAETLREALDTFYRAHRREDQGAALNGAVTRLQAMLQQVEPLVSHPEDRYQLVLDQRWGYLLVRTQVQAAQRELQHLATRCSS
jgi:hypothetical protein